MNEGDESPPRLSEHTMAVLAEFLAEEKHELEMGGSVEEDWQLSQFWYDTETSDKLAREVVRISDETAVVACIACPSVYFGLSRIGSTPRTVRLLEFDRRFGNRVDSADEYVFYDYNEPLDIPDHLVGQCDVIVADPPFLSEECLSKFALTIERLQKSTSTTSLIFCTGAAVENIVLSCLPALHRTTFEPRHQRNLGNQFACYVNYSNCQLD